jgi:hypothetical protein
VSSVEFGYPRSQVVRSRVARRHVLILGYPAFSTVCEKRSDTLFTATLALFKNAFVVHVYAVCPGILIHGYNHRSVKFFLLVVSSRFIL